MNEMMIEEVWWEMMEALGYSEWWETEDEWDASASLLVALGFDAAEVEAFFDEMAWDL